MSSVDTIVIMALFSKNPMEIIDPSNVIIVSNCFLTTITKKTYGGVVYHLAYRQRECKKNSMPFNIVFEKEVAFQQVKK